MSTARSYRKQAGFAINYGQTTDRLTNVAARMSDTLLNLSDRIAEQMRQKIVHGEFAPGQRLSEAALSEHLQISRNTLREVFRLLTKEGLLRHHIPHALIVACAGKRLIQPLLLLRA